MSENNNSDYLQYLPSIYAEVPLLQEFLTAFQQVMTRWTDVSAATISNERKGLEEIIADIASIFDPSTTRQEFLNWLSGWVALSLRADWTVGQKREFLANIVPLYRSRGTKANLIKLLQIYTRGLPAIDEGDFVSIKVGVNSRIGEMRIGEPPPHFFRVTVNLGKENDQNLRKRQFEIAYALIEMQKPAHTTFELKILSFTMQIGRRSTIGVDTLIGNTSLG